jgi:hypothetical protein
LPIRKISKLADRFPDSLRELGIDRGNLVDSAGHRCGGNFGPLGNVTYVHKPSPVSWNSAGSVYAFSTFSTVRRLWQMCLEIASDGKEM